MIKHILDGGMGREVERMGAPFAQPEWSALSLMETPEIVAQAHANFIDAGAQVITTNCYAIIPFHIGQERFDTRGCEWIKLSATLARDAADASDHVIKVAGSLPPLFGSYRPDLFDPVLAPALLDAFIEEQAPYVDLWLAETLCSRAEARAVCDALKRHGSDLPLWLSYCPTRDDWQALHKGEGKTSENLNDVISFTRDETSAAAILYNCCPMETAESAIARTAEILGQDRNLMIGAYPNLFKRPSIGANVSITPLRTQDITPEDYCTFAQKWSAAGADIIGGCCGVSPAHIAALKTL
ncbi:MAG: homocysteine S-methyltransferase family protein [Bdellovibrionales bacterium]